MVVVLEMGVHLLLNLEEKTKLLTRALPFIFTRFSTIKTTFSTLKRKLLKLHKTAQFLWRCFKLCVWISIFLGTYQFIGQIETSQCSKQFARSCQSKQFCSSHTWSHWRQRCSTLCFYQGSFDWKNSKVCTIMYV